MSLFNQFVVMGVLIALCAFLSMSEISLAAARKVKLKLLGEAGQQNALKVLALQEHPGNFFAASQIGLNAIAILGGILGEAAFTPYFLSLLSVVYNGPALETLSFLLSFIVVTSLFILFADLMPKRLAMLAPEKMAMLLVQPLLIFIKVCQPLSFAFNALANFIFRIFKVDTSRKDDLTFDDISAIVDAGADAGILQHQEHHLIENVFELESRTLPSSMTARESIVYFTLTEDEASIRRKLGEQPHSKFLVCDGQIDRVVGYVDTKDILLRILNNQSLVRINEATIRNVLMVPDTLTLSELLDRFKATRQDFAAVLNEYALVVGVITLNDVMSTVMGDLMSHSLEEQQVVQRDENSWLIDGGTPIEDVKRALNLDALPDEENYETVAGFMMYMLRKIPKRTDFVEHASFKFEVVDIDNYKIDQLLVTRIQ